MAKGEDAMTIQVGKKKNCRARCTMAFRKKIGYNSWHIRNQVFCLLMIMMCFFWLGYFILSIFLKLTSAIKNITYNFGYTYAITFGIWRSMKSRRNYIVLPFKLVNLYIDWQYQNSLISVLLLWNLESKI